ncbi:MULTISPECIES: GDYXXLXY domain-containing protein [Candidatus Ichthyocystis]|uniref:GDYXXLXY domain-containing protein n=1 Tax=Candidatus Ichthyocystis TaxID=2929841 RepID=UPI000B8267D1|nr:MULTISPECIES: GDYXXLXY domain-containing protein [Ichthyocystis]
MREKVMAAWLLAVILIINYAIYEKELIKNYGKAVFVKLRPYYKHSTVQRDYVPYRHSLIQGDYVLLKYDIEEQIPKSDIDSYPDMGYIVITTSASNIASFLRLYRGESLASDEKLLRFKKNNNSIRVLPNSFLFQSGKYSSYENSRYGLFRFSNSGRDYVLVNLADNDKRLISVS